MADRDPIDDRIRRAWADLEPDDGVHPPLPPAAWDRVAEAVASEGASTPPGGAERRRHRRPRPLLVAAAVLVLLVAGALTARLTLTATDAPEVAARAELSSEGLAGAPPASGRAELVEVDDHLELEVSVPGVRPGDGEVLEVWLIDPASDGLQSLGLVDGRARLPVPDTIDTDRFSVVDVSVEPLDGDPGHSAESVVRGALATT